MKKMLCLVALLCLTSFPALAQQTADALVQAYVPANAQLLSQEKDDGLMEYDYWLADSREFLEILADPATGQVIRAEYELRNDEGGTSVTISEADAQAQVLALYPEASIACSKIDTDDRRYHYEIVFTTAEYTGVAEVNAATGAVMKRELYYAAALGAGELTFQAAQEKVLANWPDSTSVFLAPELDDGRTVYEGEVLVNGGATRITFELDASSQDFRDYRETAVSTAATSMPTAEPTSAARSGAGTVLPEATSAPASTGSNGLNAGGTSTLEGGLIGTARAMEIAQQEIGGGEITSIKLEREHGKQLYEVEAFYNGYEYELEIDAETGEIIKWERERED